MRNSTATLLILCLVIAACGPEKKAAKNFRMGKYEKVIDYYTDVLEKQPNNGKANYMVAESFRLSNRIKQAEVFYAKAGGPGVNEDSVQLYYSKALQANGKYDEAKKCFEESATSTREKKMKNRAQKKS